MKLLASARTTPNIALVKYWGKRCQKEILPLNSSLSLTLGPDFLTSTRVLLSPTQSHHLTINNRISRITDRMARVLNQFQRHGGGSIYYDILSDNHFPTASGMASSASGLSAVSLALNSTLTTPLPWQQLLRYTRIGSGSAIRSMKGGLVEWDAKSGLIHQHLTANEVKYMRIMVLLDDIGEKEVTSREGMHRCKETSQLLKYRGQLASSHIKLILQAFKDKNFKEISRLIRKQSNQLHAICMDALPPIFYLTPFSKNKIQLVQKYLLQLTDGEIGYTFDAGSHCFLIFPEHHEQSVLAFFRWLYEKKQVDMNEMAKNCMPRVGECVKAEELAERALEKGQDIHMPMKILLSRIGDDPIAYNGEWS